MLVPSSLAIVLEAHEERERMHAVALWSAVAALAAGIGPPLGGLLITASSWRLVFLVNIPVGAGRRGAGRARARGEPRARDARQMPDLLGGVVLALAIASLVLAVVKGQEWGWDERARPRLVPRSARAGRILRVSLQPPSHAGRRPLAAAHPRVRALQWRDDRDGERLLRLHAVQRPVPDGRLALLDSAPRASR